MPSLYGIRHRITMRILNGLFSGTECWRIKRALLSSLGYSIGRNTRIVGPIYCSAKMTIGDNTWIGRNFAVNGNGEVIIGDNCDIGPDVSFYTGGHRIGDGPRRAGKGQHYKQVVNDGVWICAKATIVNNSTIGDGSVIAACACVVDSIPQNCLAGGVPARVIKKLDH